MTKLEPMTRRSRTGLRRAAVTLLCGLLLSASPGTALAQFFNSGSSGVHGEFPPVPTAGPPTEVYHWLIWNVGTGHVWFCLSYTIGTGVDACDGTPVAEAQIPVAGGVPDGVYHFTNVNVVTPTNQHRWIVPVGVNPNTPLTILSQNDITFAGNPPFGTTAIFYARGWDGKAPAGSATNLSVVGGRGGPGSFDGGLSGNGGPRRGTVVRVSALPAGWAGVRAARPLMESAALPRRPHRSIPR